MRFIAVTLLFTASTACASPRDPATSAYPKPTIAERLDQERQDERVQRMKNEFNTLFPNG